MFIGSIGSSLGNLDVWWLPCPIINLIHEARQLSQRLTIPLMPQRADEITDSKALGL